MLEVAIDSTFDDWRRVARSLLKQGISPERVYWRARGSAQVDLLSGASVIDVEDTAAFNTVPREFLRLAASVACHSSSERWNALYRVLYRLENGEPSLLEVATDPDIHSLTVMDKAIRRDVHKMHAFVRFRAVRDAGTTTETHYIAWFEPAHHIVQRATPFFARRFASMRWSILTPDECAHWDGESLQFTPGLTRESCPEEDELEELWCSYYAHTFNPARVSVATMQAEMPQRYWINLPEAPLIARLTREAPARVLSMLEQAHRAPAHIPEELRSQVGEVTVPDRSRISEPEAPTDLDAPGAWDTVHDPGVSAAETRARELNRTEALTPDSTIRIGTASWTDPTLLRCGKFYPPDVSTAEARLGFYASRFPLVEVDSTYYVPPSRGIAALWAARTPDHFVFDIKAYALMTGHAAETKRMPDWLRRMLPRSVASSERVTANELPSSVVDEVWQRFLNALAPLDEAGKLGPVLLQFPRWFTPTRENAETLRVARERLGTASAAVEFRNPEWVEGRIAARTFSLLERLNLTYVVVDAPPGTRSSMPPVLQVTTPDLSVVRLHGRRSDMWEAKHKIVSERYRYLYDSAQLGEWTERIGGIADLLRKSKSEFADQAKARQGVHVVFNNCHANYGTTNAIEITKTLIEFDKQRRRPPHPV